MGKREVTEWLKSNKKRYISGGDVFYEWQRRKAGEWAMSHLECEDIVEVVRCKDCWKSEEGLCSYKLKNVPGKDFCGDGERKNNG